MVTNLKELKYMVKEMNSMVKKWSCGEISLFSVLKYETRGNVCNSQYNKK